MEKNIHDKIIESVSKIVHESGFKAVTTREVCKRAQISAPTLYHYFPNKQSMLEAATLSAYKKYIQDQNKKFPVRNPVRRIIYLWNGYFEFIEKEPEFFKIILLAFFSLVPSIAIPNAYLQCCPEKQFPPYREYALHSLEHLHEPFESQRRRRSF